MRFLLIFLYVFSHSMVAQSGAILHSPHVISSGGSSISGVNYNLCFTIGELAVTTYNQESFILTQGFHQNDYQFVNITESHLTESQLTIFPNPTNNISNIICETPHLTGSLSIKTLSGQLVFSNEIFSTSQIQQIDLSTFSQGMYFLEVVLGANDRIVYQIQKIN